MSFQQIFDSAVCEVAGDIDAPVRGVHSQTGRGIWDTLWLDR